MSLISVSPADVPSGKASPRAAPLRVGFWLGSARPGSVPAWAAHAIGAAAEAPHSKVVLFMMEEDACAEKEEAGWCSGYKKLLYRAYRTFDEFVHTVQADARAPTDVREVIVKHLRDDASYATASVEARRAGACEDDGVRRGSLWGAGGSGELDSETVDRVADACLDVLVDIGIGRAPRGPILSVPRYGVWVHRFGYAGRGTAEAGFFETFRHDPVTRVSLHRYVAGRAEDAATGELLCQPPLQEAYTATDTFSVKRNRDRLLWKCALLVPRALAALHRRRKEEESGDHMPFSAAEPSRATIAPPSALSSAAFAKPLARYAWRYAFKKFVEQWAPQRWYLLYAFQDALLDEGSFRGATTLGLDQFERLVPPPGCAGWADPFVLHRDGRYHVFVEEIAEDTGKGHISVFSIAPGHSPTRTQKIIEASHHLSYPFVFEYDGRLYMMLESKGNRTVSIYECTGFPHRWIFHKNIMEDVLAVDPTLFYHEGRWWLFLGMQAHPHVSAHEELFLFHAQDPLASDWQAHPLNPLVSDARCARPAGRVFEKGGALYRPAQDCSWHYGYGLRLYRITALSPTDYAEEEVAFAEPTWDYRVRGVHTLNHDARLTFADAAVRTPRWSAW